MATKNKKKAKTNSKKVTKISSAKKMKGKTVAKKASQKKSASATSSNKVISLAGARQTRNDKIDWSSYLTPVDDRVLVELGQNYEKTPGGLFIPDSAQHRPNSGKVVAVGPGKRDKKGRRKPLDVRVGDKIMYVDYAGSKLKLEGKDLVLLNESDILGVLET